MYFLLTKDLLQPMPLLLLLTGFAFVNLWRKQKESRGRLRLLAAPLVVLTLVSLPAAVYPLLGALEWRFPPVEGRPRGAEAIVVLSGGIREADRTRPRPELSEDTLYRCLHAAELYHRGKPCLVIVTGGALDPASSLPRVAPSMREMLVRLGVAGSDVAVEPEARTTYENAVETRKVLAARGLHKVVLVTEAVHMRRALLCFRKQGVEAVPAACLHRATQFHFRPNWFLPSPVALRDFMAVAHEGLGLAWYRALGKI